MLEPEPVLGLSLQALQGLCDSAGPKITWWELTKTYIAPATQKSPGPWLRKLSDEDVGLVTYYVVYRSTALVRDTVAALSAYLQHEDPSTTFLWLDVLCTNLHPDTKEQLVSPFTAAADAMAQSQGVLAILDTHGDWVARAWMLWELWQCLFTRGSAALHLLTPGHPARELARRVHALDLTTAGAYGYGDTLKMKEWMETHFGSEALASATAQLRLALLLGASDSQNELLQLRMAAQRLHELHNSLLCQCPVPDTNPANQNDAQIPKHHVGWGRGGVTAAGAWAPDPHGSPAPTRYLQWLSLARGSPQGRMLLILGDSGTGKSCLCATLCGCTHPPSATVVCKANDVRNRDPVRVVQSIAYQLGMSCGIYATHLLALVDAESVWSSVSMEDAVDLLLVRPLAAIAADMERAQQGSINNQAQQGAGSTSETQLGSPARGSSPTRVSSPPKHVRQRRNTVEEAPGTAPMTPEPEPPPAPPPQIPRNSAVAPDSEAGNARSSQRSVGAALRSPSPCRAQLPNIATRQQLLRRIPPHGLVLLIDGLDELFQGVDDDVTRVQMMSLLWDHLYRLPPWVRFVVTCTPNRPNLLTAVATLQPARVSPAELYRLPEAQVCLARHILHKAGSAKGSLALAKRLISHTEGDLFTARLLARLLVLRRGPAAPSQATVAELPKARADVLQAVLKLELKAAIRSETPTADIRQLLQVLVAAREPLHLSHLRHLGLLDTLPSLPGLGSLFYIDLNRLCTVHPSVLAWLSDPEVSGDLYADPTEGDKLLSTLHTNTSLLEGGNTLYALRHSVTHLACANRLPDLERLAQNPTFWERVFECGLGSEVLKDLHDHAPPDNSLFSDVLRWLHQSQRVLSLHPHAVWQLSWDAPASSVMHRAVYEAPETTGDGRLSVQQPEAWMDRNAPQWPALITQVTVQSSIITWLALPTAPELTLVALCLSSGRILLWCLHWHRQIADLPGHAGPVDCAAFVPDSRCEGQHLLASYSSKEMAVKLWSLASSSQVACATGLSFRAPGIAQEIQSIGFYDVPADDRRFFVRLYPSSTIEFREVVPAVQKQTTRAPGPAVPGAVASPGAGAGASPEASRAESHPAAPASAADSNSTALALLEKPKAHVRSPVLRRCQQAVAALTLTTPTLAVVSADLQLLVTSCGSDMHVWDNKQLNELSQMDEDELKSKVEVKGWVLSMWDHSATLSWVQRVCAGEATWPSASKSRSGSPTRECPSPHLKGSPPKVPPPGEAASVACITVAAVLDATKLGGVHILECTTYQELAVLPHPENVEVCCVCVSPDGVLIATGASDRKVRLWSTTCVYIPEHDGSVPNAAPLLVLDGHVAPVTCLTFLASGVFGLYHLVSGSTDESLRIWDLGSAYAAAQQQQQQNADTDPPVASRQVTPEVSKLSLHQEHSSSSSAVTQPTAGASGSVSAQQQQSVSTAAPAAEASLTSVAADSSAPTQPGKGGKLQNAKAAKAAQAAAAAEYLRNRGRTLLHPKELAKAGRAAMAQSNILIPAAVRGTLGPPAPAIQLPPHPTQLESTRQFDHIPARITHHATEDLQRRQAQVLVALLDGHEGGVTSVTTCGFRVASGATDRCVRLWRCKGRLWFQETLLGKHPGPVTSLSFSGNGDLLVSGSCRSVGREDGMVKVWHLATASCVVEVPHCFAALWCPGPGPAANTQSPSTGQTVPGSSAEGQLLALCSRHCVRVVKLDACVKATITRAQVAALSAVASAKQGALASSAATFPGPLPVSGSDENVPVSEPEQAELVNVAHLYTVAPIQLCVTTWNGSVLTSDGLSIAAFSVQALLPPDCC